MLYNDEVLCSLWGTDWIIKYYLEELGFQKVFSMLPPRLVLRSVALDTGYTSRDISQHSREYGGTKTDATVTLPVK
jgi:hypothetical protein